MKRFKWRCCTHYSPRTEVRGCSQSGFLYNPYRIVCLSFSRTPSKKPGANCLRLSLFILKSIFDCIYCVYPSPSNGGVQSWFSIISGRECPSHSGNRGLDRLSHNRDIASSAAIYCVCKIIFMPYIGRPEGRRYVVGRSLETTPAGEDLNINYLLFQCQF